MVGGCACSPAGDTDGGSSETTSASSSEKELKSVKPCDMLSPDTLDFFGLEAPGEPADTLPRKAGCNFGGDPVSVTLLKDERNTVSSNEQKSVWVEFERLGVNGRTGARAITQGTTKARLCNVMFEAGEGLIQVQARENQQSDDVDECRKALEIAKRIEPNVPELA
ncbi:DUF3558 domain-containing protein [Actinopolyspora mortivallis]|uniref:DUF3558 domain-containing protein n=1 Tax=Actinopolyspora mortivallis TaxID=33906 RepID=A0A2T0H218_ACTMO|nr:DUF3558 domain-containing protein [Actinopolyspora mortivallis]